MASDNQSLATPDQLTLISFDDIQEAIGSTPPLQRDQVKENFIGITVDWIAYLNSAKKKDNGLIGLSLSADIRKSFKFIYCTIPLAEYPEIRILPENSRIHIRGEIENVGEIDVTLKNVKLTFIKDE